MLSFTFSDLIKSKPPQGFTAIPGGTKGGYRKKVAGKYVYWYEGKGGAKGAGADVPAELHSKLKAIGAGKSSQIHQGAKGNDMTPAQADKLKKMGLIRHNTISPAAGADARSTAGAMGAAWRGQPNELMVQAELTPKGKSYLAAHAPAAAPSASPGHMPPAQGGGGSSRTRPSPARRAEPRRGLPTSEKFVSWQASREARAGMSRSLEIDGDLAKAEDTDELDPQLH